MRAARRAIQRHLRRQGRLPAVVFGHGISSESVSLDAHDFELLRRKAGNISEIAFETGFTSPSYFSKCFQKQYGRLPSDYFPAFAD